MPGRVTVTLLILLLSSLGTLEATGISVPHDYSTIQSAIDAAIRGDEILVEPGIYFENIDFKGKEIALRSRHGAAVTIIDGNQAGSAVSFVTGEGAPAVIEGFTIRNGFNTKGGGINCTNASPTISGNRIVDNSSMDGGGIHCDRSSPVISGNTIVDNACWKGGGIHLNDNSSPLIANNMILSNEAGGYGGGICCWSTCAPTITNNTIVANASNEKGGGIHCTIQSSPVIANTILWFNTASEGGELWVGYDQHPSTLEIDHSNVQGGQARVHVTSRSTLLWGANMIDAHPAFVDADQGNLHVSDASPCLDAGDNGAQGLLAFDIDGDPRVGNGLVDIGADELFIGRILNVPADYATIQDAIVAAVDGDEIFVAPDTQNAGGAPYTGKLDFLGKAITVKSELGPHVTTLDGNQADCVVSFTSGEGPGSVLEGFTITNGSATQGGGVYCRDSSPTITGNIITGNSAMDGGGICCLLSSAVIAGNRISANSAWNGGGLHCEDNSSPMIVDNMVLCNHADNCGGGICCRDTVFPVITNNTIVGNDSGADGGGIYCTGNSRPMVANAIIWDNSAVVGAEIWVGDSLNPSSLIVSYSDVKGGQAATYVVGGCFLVWGQGMINSDPDFIDPSGSSLHIRAQSPCANTGDNNAAGLQDRDFEGDPRISHDIVDMGADELFAGENVFIIVIDGLRSNEGFGDLMHQYIPNIWNTLRPLGTIYTNFLNLGFTVTTPAHQAMTSGVRQIGTNSYLLNYGDVERVQEEPSLFQYYRSQLGIPKNKTWIINGKGTMIMYTGICQNPAYQDNDEPSVSFTVAQPDDTTMTEFERVLDTYHPSLTLINFKEVDNIGHLNVFSNYTDAIVHADTLVYNVCRKIWQDPYYDNNTTIFILTDHGRHTDGVATGFKDHGCSCMGCRNVAFLAIGPDIKTNSACYSEAHLSDLAPTIASIFGINIDYGRGRLLHEMFVNPPAQSPPVMHDPVAAGSGTRVHAATARFYEGKSKILYAQTDNNGQTWKKIKILSTTNSNMAPSIAAEGDRVAVAWSSFQANGNCKMYVRESTNGGISFAPAIRLIGDLTYHEDLFPHVKYDQGVLTVVWTELAFGSSRLHVRWIQNGTIINSDRLDPEYVFHVIRARAAPAPTGTHIVFQDFKPVGKNWEISYIFYDGTPLPTSPSPSPIVQISNTVGESTWPDVAADSNGVHVVWCDEDNGYFTIRFRNSPDGVNWSNTLTIGSNTLGAWHPRIAVASDRLVVVWEGYDNDSPCIFSTESTDGGVTWSAAANLSGTGNNNVFPSLTIDPQDMMHLFWMKGPAPFKLGQYHAQIR